MANSTTSVTPSQDSDECDGLHIYFHFLMGTPAILYIHCELKRAKFINLDFILPHENDEYERGSGGAHTHEQNMYKFIGFPHNQMTPRNTTRNVDINR